MPKKITKTTTFRKTTKTVRKVKPKSTFAKRVKAVVNKQAELKMLSRDTGLIGYNSPISVAGDINMIVPYQIQGTDTGQRVGNEITCRTLLIKGHMFLNQTYASSLPNCRMGIRLFVLSSKRYKAYDDVSLQVANHLPLLLKNGSSSQSFSGNIQDLYLPVNREIYTVHHDKVFQLAMPYQASGVGFMDTKDMVKFFNISIKCHNKKLTYEDTTSTAPQNWCPFLCLGYAHLDGSSPDVVSSVVQMQYLSTLTYTDL